MGCVRLQDGEGDLVRLVLRAVDERFQLRGIRLFKDLQAQAVGDLRDPGKVVRGSGIPDDNVSGGRVHACASFRVRSR